ncbi:hypothetical protein ABZO31_26635 [Streptomyces sp. HUAS MG47]|uniref:hypothetical protein n=1 Tax=Streptomyces solicamelliae TaxID=3231716 RepID=UPI003877C8ED
MDQRKKKMRNVTRRAALGLTFAVLSGAALVISGPSSQGEVRAAEPAVVLLDTSWPAPTP